MSERQLVKRYDRVVAAAIRTFTDRDYLVRSHDTKRFAETPVEIEIRMLDFEALQRIYVTD